MAAYTSMGFRVAHNVLVYRYVVAEQPVDMPIIGE
jgi:hypothetical protein